MKKLLFFMCLVLAIASCKKEEKINPYDLVKNQGQIQPIPEPEPDPNTIQGLHRYIFAPTCANSGCHDGNFEPDFRTIKSSYNTLVLQPVIKNNPSGTFSYRVQPGNSTSSVLLERLLNDIDGQSGIMPLALDPGSDWNEKKAQYIENIRTWINNGARDVFGNAPQQASLPPQLQGMFISLPGSTDPLPRNIQSGAVVIPSGTTQADVYFACSDDQFAADELGTLLYRLSASMNQFEGIEQQSLSLVSPVTQTGYNGNPVEFRFKATLNLSGLAPLQVHFLRIYMSDENPEITEIPSAASAEYIKRYYSFQLGE
jgi:hypothetical protein